MRPLRGDRDEPDEQRDDRRQEAELRPRGEARGEARHGERRQPGPPVVARRAAALTRIATAARMQGDADDVVEGLARLELDQVLGAERDRAADQALRAEAVGPADRSRRR